jgi:hypothetical protein
MRAIQYHPCLAATFLPLDAALHLTTVKAHRGRLADYIDFIGTPHRRERLDIFHDVQLTIKGTVRVFQQKVALEDAIGVHAFAPLEVLSCV